MMATASTIESPADVSASHDPQLASSARDVDITSRLVNGTPNNDIENKRITSLDDPVNSAEASVSGGSDTEASRADSSKLKDGDKGHSRTASSAKKPATFKAVSVNKTFLKAATPPAASKTIDKPSSSTPPPGSASILASKPRLVAKSGGGTRDSSPRFSAVNGGKPASTPDANAVWNKNRPTPAPDPKKLTDEELKKYGIHVASRLDEDDTQGQNKWADIDDDDEDWAPEAITWTDGTKTTLPHTDEHHAPPVVDNAPPVAPVAAPIAAPIVPPAAVPEKARSPAPSSSTGSPLTKPGSLASGKGLILKGANQDKPTLVAKPPAQPTPAKSPWATLPPVQRASPGLEQNPPGSRGPLKGFASGGVISSVPAPKEIAADDFSRSSWREGSHHSNRELYNSQSGRYEPVPDRRGSLRTDQSKPSLLQRPSPTDQPAEPSSAFQTHRAAQDAPYRRRRGSSNVSGGSGSFYPRMGKGSDGYVPPPDVPGMRRPSFAGSVESPASSAALPVPAARPQPGHPGWNGPTSPAANFADPNRIEQQQPSADDVEYQKKLMRERNELARKRRQEQEAAEEAARKERIQKKLDAMGPPPPKKSDKKETSKAEESAKPPNIQQRDTQDSAEKIADSPTTEVKEATESETPVPGGLSPELKTQNKLPPTGPAARRRPSHGQEANSADSWTGPGPRPDRFASWAHGAQPPRNVWGSPDNDRGLGNGTFNPDLGLIAGSAVTASQPGKSPAPIGPPGASRPSTQTRSAAPAPIGSRPGRYGHAGSELASKWVTSVAESDKQLGAARLAEKNERERQLAERGMTVEDSQPIIKDTWRPVHVPGDGTRQTVAPTEPKAHQAPNGPWQSSGDDPLRSSTPKEGPSRPSTAGVIGSGPSPSSGGSAILPQAGQVPSSQSRLSRFFPARDARLDGQAQTIPSRPQSPSPPPPTLEDHPVYEGDVMHPHVSLPKPQPVVKLPPSLQHHQQKQQQHGRPLAWSHPTPFVEAPMRSPPRPHHHRTSDARQEDWQQKFNNLLNNGKLSPQKSIGVDPASKNSLDHVVHQDAATVSLPRNTGAPAASGPSRNIITSKPMAEECFDEQEIGSLPSIKFPKDAPDAAWHPAEAQAKALPKKFLIQATTADLYRFTHEVTGGGNLVRVRFPWMDKEDERHGVLPFSASRGGRGAQGRSGPRTRGGARGNNSKRDVSNPRGNNSKRDASNSRESSSSNHTGRGGRGGYRGRGSETRNRNSSAQQAQKA